MTGLELGWCRMLQLVPQDLVPTPGVGRAMHSYSVSEIPSALGEAKFLSFPGKKKLKHPSAFRARDVDRGFLLGSACWGPGDVLPLGSHSAHFILSVKPGDILQFMDS